MCEIFIGNCKKLSLVASSFKSFFIQPFADGFMIRSIIKDIKIKKATSKSSFQFILNLFFIL